MKRLIFLLVSLQFCYLGAVFAQYEDCAFKIQITTLSNFLPSSTLTKKEDIPEINDKINSIIETLKHDKAINEAWNSITTNEKVQTTGSNGKKRKEHNFEALKRIGEEVKSRALESSPKSELNKYIKRITSNNDDSFPNAKTFPEQRKLIAIAYMNYLLQEKCLNTKVPTIAFTKAQEEYINTRMSTQLNHFGRDFLKRKPLLIWLGILSLLILGFLISTVIVLVKNYNNNNKEKTISSITSEDIVRSYKLNETKERVNSKKDIENLIDNKLNSVLTRLQNLEWNQKSSLEIKTPIQETRKSYSQTNPVIKDVVETFYSIAPPGGRNFFLGNKLEKEFKNKETIFEISIKNKESAIFTLANNKETRKHAFNMLDTYILPAMDIEGERKDTDLISRITPGHLVKEGNNWRIKNKGKIYF